MIFVITTQTPGSTLVPASGVATTLNDMEEFRFSAIPITEVVELDWAMAAQLVSLGIFQVREEC